jgi:hypothetical protein
MPVGADFLVELRRFEPLTSAVQALAPLDVAANGVVKSRLM